MQKEESEQKGKNGQTHLVADSKDSGTGSSEDGDRPANHRLELLDRPERGGMGDTGSEWSESRPETPECLYDRPPPQHFLHPAYHGIHPAHHPAHTRFQSSPPPSNVNKPRIWSLADMASSKDSTGKTPFRSVLPHHVPHPGNFVRNADFYRSFYGAHIPGSSSEHQALLENYSKTFGASFSAATNGTNPPLSSVAAAIAAAHTASTDGATPAHPAPFGLIVPTSASSSSSSESAAARERESLQKSVDSPQRA